MSSHTALAMLHTRDSYHTSLGRIGAPHHSSASHNLSKTSKAARDPQLSDGDDRYLVTLFFRLQASLICSQTALQPYSTGEIMSIACTFHRKLI